MPFAAGEDPLLKPESEYPEWLWENLVRGVLVASSCLGVGWG